MRYFLRNIVLFATVIASSLSSNQFLRNKQLHKAQVVSTEEVRYLAGLSNTSHIEEILDNILIPRVVGTPNHEKVFNYLKKELEKLKWNVEVDEFSENTPFGSLKFKNIIGTLDPNADRFLVFACHYDSKHFDNVVFVGATDSAVPCAMMLNMAKVMKKELDSIKSNSDVSLKFMFLDGEEAFVNWGPNDSIYGAKHLAKSYENNQIQVKSTGELVNDLHRIDIMVLLDLIGAPNPIFYSYFPNTERWHLKLVDSEERLASLNLLKNYSPSQMYFKKMRTFSAVEDDHIPFLKRDVPILHLITSPFPKEWHTPKDDRNLIDMPTVENINKILRLFTAEYLHLLVNKR